MPRNVFITGVTGFIGSAVANRFANSGYNVYGLVRSEEKAKEFIGKEISPIIGDIKNPKTFEDIFEKMHIFIHCATGFSSTPFEDDEVFVDSVARSCEKSKIKKVFIQTSGCLIYGGKIGSDLFCEDSEINPPAKLTWREKIEKKVLENPNFAGVIVRPGFLYGSSGSYTSYYFNIVEQEKIIIKGNPEKRWSFIHFADLAEGYIKIAECPIKVIEKEIFHFGDYTNASVNDIIEKLKRITEKNEATLYMDRENDFWGFCCECDCVLDCRKANNLLEWRPRNNFYEGLEKYYKSWKASKKN